MLVKSFFQEKMKIIVQKFCIIKNATYFCTPQNKGHGALVKGLRHLPFTEESRVRFPYALQRKGLKVAKALSINSTPFVLLGLLVFIGKFIGFIGILQTFVAIKSIHFIIKWMLFY